LRDSCLADLRAARDSLEQLRKLQHETNLAFLESCRVLGIAPPPTLLTDTGYTPPTTAVRSSNEAGRKRSIKNDGSEGNDEDTGDEEDEEEDDDEDEGTEGGVGYEGESEDGDEDSSDSGALSTEASSTSPRPSTSPKTSPLGPISDILASVWGNEPT